LGDFSVSLGGTDTAYAVAPGPGGTTAAVISGSNDDALIRLTPSGSLDTSFNSTGKIVGSSGSGTIRAILVQTNGEVLAGGDASSGTAQKVWMFTPAGAADTAFASGGTLTANSGATVYGWAVASGPTQRIVVAGSYGGDEALAAFAPASQRLYAEQSANYNVTSMVDPYGNVDQRFVYDPYGNMTVLSAAWTPQSDLFDTQIGFQGMWLDQASGLYHTANRDYSAALGRWVEVDPAGYVNGPNGFQFTSDAPAAALDPSGENGVRAVPDHMTLGLDGGFEHVINWQLDQPSASASGWVVQSVTIDVKVWDLQGQPLVDGDKLTAHRSYLEAWPVSKGQPAPGALITSGRLKGTATSPSDTFYHAATQTCTRGTLSYFGVAYFLPEGFPGFEHAGGLPGSWIMPTRQQVRTWAGNLPSFDLTPPKNPPKDFNPEAQAGFNWPQPRNSAFSFNNQLGTPAVHAFQGHWDSPDPQTPAKTEVDLQIPAAPAKG